MPIGPMPMPHEPRRWDNPGEPPSKWPADTLVEVEWSCGRTSRQPYRVDQLAWEKRGWDFDVARFWRA